MSLNAPLIPEAKSSLYNEDSDLYDPDEGAIQQLNPNQAITVFSSENPYSRVPDYMASATVALNAGWEMLLQEVSKLYPCDPCEIRFENVRYDVESPQDGSNNETVGSRFLNNLQFWNQGKSSQTTVLNDLTGIIKTGTMTLVLGAPGSGKTSFLKMLAGRLPSEAITSGSIQMNGKSLNSFVPERAVGFVQSLDHHLPHLTVRETLAFAFQCTNPEPDAAFAETFGTEAHRLLRLQHYQAMKIEIYLRILGLQGCADTVVGNESIRGISGGEKKRVTIGEALLSPCMAFVMDEISTGLDSSATYEIINSLKIAAEQLGQTFVVSLLQPSPNIFDKFDEVVLLAKGRIVYQGPRARCESYFESIGFKRPKDKDFAEFLQEVTSYPHEFVTPEYREKHGNLSVDGFVQLFRLSDIFQETQQLLQVPSKYTNHPVKKVFQTPYALSFGQSTKLCLKREVTLAKRDKKFIRARIMQCIVFGLIVGTLFYQLDPAAFGSRYGLIFNCCMFLAVGNFAQIPVTINNRSVFYKHRRNLQFPTSSYALAFTLTRLPLAVIETLVFSLLMYFLSNMSPGFTHYATFYSILLLENITIGAFMRMVAAGSQDAKAASPNAGLCLILFVVFAGFLITPGSIPNYWIWVYYISPLAWAVKGLVWNEFGAKRYDVPFSEMDDRLQRDVYLEAFEFPTNIHNIFWVYVALPITFIIFSVALGFVLEYVRHDQVTHNKERTPTQLEGSETRQSFQAASVHNTPKLGYHKSVFISLDPSASNPTLPFDPVTFVFRNVSYYVPIPGDNEPKCLLNSVSGYFRPGTMTALMGSSGAGKTTLLDVLSGRCLSQGNGARIEGDIRTNNVPFNHLTMGDNMCYVEQMDIHTPTATVFEAVSFSANLRLPSNLSEQRRSGFVQNVLNLLELEGIADQRIGNAVSGGITREQRKRVTIAVELVSNPSMLFLDEPTSGLDSRGADMVMKVLSKIADTGRTLVITIHQPSSSIFNMFNNVLLLSKGGRVAYLGEVKKKDGENTLVNYFEEVSGQALSAIQEEPDALEQKGADSISLPSVPMNIADWMLDVTGAGFKKGGEDDMDFAAEYRKSKLYKKNMKRIRHMLGEAVHDPKSPSISADSQRTVVPRLANNNLSLPSRAASTTASIMDETFFPPADAPVTEKFRASFCTQLYYVTDKAVSWMWRTPNYNLTRNIFMTCVALLFGSVFFQIKTKTEAQVHSALAVIYVTSIFCGIVSYMFALPVVIEERRVYVREVGSGMFSPLVYALSIGVVELPYLIVSTGFFVILFFKLVGFALVDLPFYWLVFFLHLSLMTYYGQFLAVLLPNQQVAQIVASGFNSLWNLFCGFLITRPNIPAGWFWFYSITPARYTFEALCTKVMYCDPHDDTCPMMSTADGTEMSVWSFIKMNYGFRESRRWMCVLILLGFVLLFRIGTFIGLKKRVNR